jgi:salicylate hydroxylase
MRVLIAGGGIGGLSAAIAMRRLGHEVVVVERAPQLTEVGAAVACSPHAMRALDFLGAGDHIRAVNDPPEASQHLDMVSGRVTMNQTLGEAGKQRYGTQTHMTHRRDLIDALAGQVQGADVRLDTTIARVDQDDRSVRLHLEDGSTLEGDILIGADGLRSTVRASLFGRRDADFTGFLAWRTVVPASNYPRAFPNIVRLWGGAGRHVISYPIRKGSQVYAGFYVPAEEVHREDWTSSGDVADLKASFADACPDILEVLEGVDHAFITGIFYRPPLDCWHKGRVVLLGDAAHPVLPTSGSGAALTLEDGVALYGCLERHGDDYASAFAEFQGRRHPRTTAVLVSSRADLQSFHETDPERRALRDRVTAGIARLDPQGSERRAWLFTYNEVAQSQRPYADILAEQANPMVRPEARRAFDRWRSIFQPEDHIHGVISQRDGYERLMAELGELPSDVAVEAVDCDGVPALRLVPPGAAPGVAVLHLHGGAHAFGSARSSAGLAARIARAAGGWALVPDIRRAPEHRAGDMSEDVSKVHAWLRGRTDRTFVSGESGGAGLALRLAVATRDAGGAPPLGLWLISPFVDATLTSESIDANRRTEPWLDRQMLLVCAGALIQGEDPALPEHSPLNHDLSRLPPMRIFAAAGEALAGDARALCEKAVGAGTLARLTLVEDSVHAYPQFTYLPEANDFLAQIRQDAERLLSVAPLAASGV